MQYKKLSRRSASRYLGITVKILAKIEAEGLVKYINIPIHNGRRIILHQENWLDDFLQKHTIQNL
jgi:hypothetical protein